MSGLGQESRGALVVLLGLGPSVRGSSRRPGNIPKLRQQEPLDTEIQEQPQDSAVWGGRRTNSEAPLP